MEGTLKIDKYDMVCTAFKNTHISTKANVCLLNFMKRLSYAFKVKKFDSSLEKSWCELLKLSYDTPPLRKWRPISRSNMNRQSGPSISYEVLALFWLRNTFSKKTQKIGTKWVPIFNCLVCLHSISPKNIALFYATLYLKVR